MRLRELADILDAELTGQADVEITGVAGIRDAGPGQITFVDGLDRLNELHTSRASAALVPLDTPSAAMPLLRVKNPRLAFARALEVFYIKPYRASGISDRAFLGQNVGMGADVSIHPHVVIENDVCIGERVTLFPGVIVCEGASIGDDCVVYPNVSIGARVVVGRRVIIHAGTVIGSDGFGFVTDGGRHHKIPQVGNVIIEDDVEIGANCAIDRATLGSTVIKQGTKIDNLVHIAHNVVIGEHCLLAGQAGIAGSTTLGNYVVLAGQAGVADHRTIGDRVMAGGKAVITKDVPAGAVIAGFNAMPLRDWLKVQAVLPKLPELKKAIASLEKQLQELKDQKQK